MLLSAVPCPGEPGKGAKERPDPGKQPVLPASTRCQRWEAGKVMHGLPTSAASRGLPRRSPGCCPAGVRHARGAPGRLPALHPPFQHLAWIWVLLLHRAKGFGAFTIL